MTLRNLSKQAFADALEKMILTTDIEKIRVTQLAKVAGATPQAFYYHFQDKYDLVAWIYMQDYAKITNEPNTEFSSLQIMKLMLQFQTRKSFYQKAFTDKSQNAIENYANKYNTDLVRKAVEQYQGFPITIEQEIAAQYHQYGVTGLFIDWIFDRITMDIQQLDTFQYNMTPDFLKEALSSFNYKNK